MFSRVKFVVLVLALAVPGLALSEVVSDATADLPKNAKPGMCYARALIPAVYQTNSETVLRKEASDKIEVIQARYEWIEEKVLAKEASKRIEVVPAEYKTVTEKILVAPEQTTWKKGRGPVEKVDNGTGEIMCLVTEPAVYKTVSKRVLVSPARTREVEVPAEYQTIKVRKLLSAPSEKHIEIPAEYSTVTKKEMVTPSKLVWKPVLCETNMGRDLVSSIQRALSSAGQNPGPIDGIIGQATMQAVRSFQRAKGLATGGLTMETLSALNVKVK